MGKNTLHSPGKGGPAIPIAASLVGLALAALLAALVAAKSCGIVRVAAQTVAVVLASLTGGLVGFLVPMIAYNDSVHGIALVAGILGTLGTIGGMSVAEYFMGWIEKPR